MKSSFITIVNIVVIWQERCSLYAEVLYLHNIFITCTMPHHFCIMWLQIFMVPMCTLGCAVSFKFVAILNGHISMILRWHWVEFPFFCWTWMPFKLPNWTSTMLVMEEYHTKVVCMHKQNSEEIPFLGHLTSKSDVCSFRVVLLELMIGRRSLDKSRSAG
jgi:hypothetical protein